MSFRRRLRTAEDIVTALAGMEPLVEQGEPTLHGEWDVCALCRVQNTSIGEGVEHKPSCPWRRAVEWVRDQETKT